MFPSMYMFKFSIYSCSVSVGFPVRSRSYVFSRPSLPTIGFKSSCRGGSKPKLKCLGVNLWGAIGALWTDGILRGSMRWQQQRQKYAERMCYSQLSHYASLYIYMCVYIYKYISYNTHVHVRANVKSGRNMIISNTCSNPCAGAMMMQLQNLLTGSGDAKKCSSPATHWKKHAQFSSVRLRIFFCLHEVGRKRNANQRDAHTHTKPVPNEMPKILSQCFRSLLPQSCF